MSTKRTPVWFCPREVIDHNLQLARIAHMDIRKLKAIKALVVSLAIGETQTFDVAWTTDALWSLAYLALAASAVGFLLYFHLLDRLGPIEINMGSYVAPIFAALAGWVVRDEVPTPYTVLGFLVIFAGFALVKRSALRAELSSIRDVLET